MPPAPSRRRGFCSRQAPPPNPQASATPTTRSDATFRAISTRLFGLFEHEVSDDLGPGVTIATTARNHDNPGVVGGGMVANDFILLPVIYWRLALPPGPRRWGAEAKDFMRRNFRRLMQLWSPTTKSPARTAGSRSIRRCWTASACRSPASRAAASRVPPHRRFLREKSVAWLAAAGAVPIWGPPPAPALSAGQHQAGTARMGTDPTLSVTGPSGHVWGHDNLSICDGSLHPTNGGFNPVLTIMALAFRTASAIVDGRH